MFVYAHLVVVRVEDPSFERALVDLTEVDPIAATAVIHLAAAPYVFTRIDRPTLPLWISPGGEAPDPEDAHFAMVPSDLTLTVSLSDGTWVEDPVTWWNRPSRPSSRPGNCGWTAVSDLLASTRTE